MKDDNLPPDNETVEDGGGCYVAGSREQDASHSFDETPKWVTDYNANRQAVNVLEAELTRLRSELQQKDEDYLSFYRWVTNNGWEEHSSGRYFYKLAFQSQWPPSENNCATGEELIIRWRNSKKQS